MRFVLTILLLLGAVAAPSCSSPLAEDERGEWTERVLEAAPPRRDILGAFEVAILNAGFPEGERDEARGTVTSGYDLQMQPFRNKGRRWQGILKVEKNDEGATVLKSRVMMDRNTTQDDTLDPGEADWSAMADDMRRSRILLQHALVLLHLEN